MTQRVATAHQKAPPNAPLAVELFAGVVATLCVMERDTALLSPATSVKP